MVHDQTISVRVLFFGAARDLAGSQEVVLALPSPASAAAAKELILASYPELQRFGNSLLFAVNEEYAQLNQPINDGDELAVFPPVSGGAEPAMNSERRNSQAQAKDADNDGSADGLKPSPSENDFFELTTQALDVGAVARRVIPPSCGATVTLDGYAREWTRGRRTLYLIYEAYQAMAVREMERLGNEAHQRFDIAHIGIVHRTGRLEIGETSVVISVGAPHRAAAFAACEWAIRELKRTVPIWKKEVFEDGEIWVEGEAFSS